MTKTTKSTQTAKALRAARERRLARAAEQEKRNARIDAAVAGVIVGEDSRTEHQAAIDAAELAMGRHIVRLRDDLEVTPSELEDLLELPPAEIRRLLKLARDTANDIEVDASDGLGVEPENEPEGSEETVGAFLGREAPSGPVLADPWTAPEPVEVGS